jgi:hypothetical protein
MNAYEIRHAILNEARSMLMDSYFNRVENERTTATLQSRPPSFIALPTTEEIKRTAEELYEFVSRK